MTSTKYERNEVGQLLHFSQTYHCFTALPRYGDRISFSINTFFSLLHCRLRLAHLHQCSIGNLPSKQSQKLLNIIHFHLENQIVYTYHCTCRLYPSICQCLSKEVVVAMNTNKVDQLSFMSILVIAVNVLLLLSINLWQRANEKDTRSQQDLRIVFNRAKRHIRKYLQRHPQMYLYVGARRGKLAA